MSKYDKISKEKIIELYIETDRSIVDVADEIGVGPNTLRRSIKYHGLETKSRGRTDSDYTTEELAELYFEEGKSCYEVAEIADMSHGGVARRLKRNGYELRNRGEATSMADRTYGNEKEGIDTDEIIDMYVNNKMSMVEIAEEVGLTRGAVGSRLYQAGVETRSESEALEIKYPDGRCGKKASNWSGGRTQANQSGYMYVYKPEHPDSTQEGYVMEHRLVMEDELGRRLKDDEDVHHLNEDTTDNRPENLIVVSRSEHKQIHDLMRKRDDLQERIKKLETLLDKNNIEYE